MSATFKRHGDGVRMELESFEVELLAELRDGLHRQLVDGDHADPVMQRLFPAQVAPEDEFVDMEVRDLIYDDLLRERLDGLEALHAIIDRGKHHRGRLRVDLKHDEAPLMLGVLNDLRLAIGARIGITKLDRDEVDEDHPAAYPVAVMDHLAWLQEQLLSIIDPASVSSEGPEV